MGAVAARGWLNASMARQNQVVARLVSAMMEMMAVVWSVAISVEMVSSNGVDGSVGCLPFERRQMAIRGVGRGCRSVRARLRACVRWARPSGLVPARLPACVPLVLSPAGAERVRGLAWLRRTEQAPCVRGVTRTGRDPGWPGAHPGCPGLCLWWPGP